MVTQPNLETAMASSDVPEEKMVAVLRHISASLSQVAGELTTATNERNPTALGVVIDKVHEFVATLNATSDGIVMPQPEPPQWPDEGEAAERHTEMASHAPSHDPTHIRPKHGQQPKSAPQKEGMLEPNSDAAPSAAQGKK